MRLYSRRQVSRRIWAYDAPLHISLSQKSSRYTQDIFQRMLHADTTQSNDTVPITLVSVCHTNTDFVALAESLDRIQRRVMDAADQPTSELNVSDGFLCLITNINLTCTITCVQLRRVRQNTIFLDPPCINHLLVLTSRGASPYYNHLSLLLLGRGPSDHESSTGLQRQSGIRPCRRWAKGERSID